MLCYFNLFESFKFMSKILIDSLIDNKYDLKFYKKLLNNF